MEKFPGILEYLSQSNNCSDFDNPNDKLLGTNAKNDLKWNLNTESIVKKANARLQLLTKVASFNPPLDNLKLIYTSFIRSHLEQSCAVWHFGMNTKKLRRFRKSAKIFYENNFW